MPEGRFIKDFPGYIFYAGKNRGGELQDVMVFVLKNETNVVTTVRAARGRLEVDAPNKLLTLRLYDGKTVDFREGRMIPGAFAELPLQLDFGQKRVLHLPPEDQRHDRRPALGRAPRLGGAAQRAAAGPQSHRRTNCARAGAELANGCGATRPRPSASRFISRSPSPSPASGSRWWAFRWASGCTGAKPTSALRVALMLVAVYYSFIMVGQSLDTPGRVCART